jgi:4-hydroxybenzoate polyprenyltransferase
MTISGIIEFLAILIGLLIVLYAIIAFIYRLIKGQPFWPNFKRMVKLIYEGIMGIG